MELLYAAAGEPKLWPEFLTAISRRFAAPGVGFIFHCPSKKQYEVNVNVGLPPESIRPYAEQFGAKDPWEPAARRLPEGRAELGSILCPPAIFRKSDFYNEFLRKFRPFIWQCCVVVENRQGILGTLSCLREPGQRDFSQRHLGFLIKLSRHLRQALVIHRRIQDCQQMALAARDVSERLDAGLILATGDGAVRYASPAAEELLQAGRFLTVQSGKLICKDRSQTESLQQLLRTANNRTLDSAVGGTMRLHDRSRSLYITVLPHTGEPNLLWPPCVAVVLTDWASLPKSRERSLKELFGLTQAETRIAMLLLQGYETSEIAERIGNTAGTVRYQLKQIYAKTGVSGQNKIVRVLSQLPGLN